MLKRLSDDFCTEDFTSSDAFCQLCISLVRPHLEYACHVWARYTQKTSTLSKVFRSSSVQWQSMHKRNGNSYEELLSLTNLSTLEKRRCELKLCHMFKIVNNLIYFPSHVVEHREEPLYSFHSYHNHTLTQPFATTNAYLHSFVPHTISLWNKLTQCHPHPLRVLNNIYVVIPPNPFFTC